MIEHYLREEFVGDRKSKVEGLQFHCGARGGR